MLIDHGDVGDGDVDNDVDDGDCDEHALVLIVIVMTMTMATMSCSDCAHCLNYRLLFVAVLEGKLPTNKW